MNVQILIPFLIYLLVLTAISIYGFRSVSLGKSGFFPGEKRINPYLTAISAALSTRGAWILLGVTTQAYIMGLSAIWLIAGFIFSEFILFLFLAPVLHKYTENNRCNTLADVFVTRFKDEGKLLRRTVSLAVIFFSMIFISSQLFGSGTVFYALLGLPRINGIIITGIIILLFIFISGYNTLVFSDLPHTLIILTILISLPVIILIRTEGFQNLHAEIVFTSKEFFSLKALSFGVLTGLLSVGLGSVGNSNILVKFMSVNANRPFLRIAGVNAGTNILIASAALITGLFAKSYFPSADAIPGAEAQNVFIGLSGAILPPEAIGLVLITIFGSVLSSSGSQIYISASSLVSDLFGLNNSNGKKNSQAKYVFYNRVSIVFLVYAAILTGIFVESDFNSFVLFSWAGMGASIGPALLMAFFWKEVTKNGIIAGVLTGSLTVILWKSLSIFPGNFYGFAPGFFLAGTAIWLVSRIDRNLVKQKFNRKASYKEIKKSNPED